MRKNPKQFLDDWVEIILGNVLYDLKPLGYSFVPNTYKYIQALDDRVNTIHLSFIKHQKEVDVVVDLSVTIIGVEEIYNKVEFELGAKPTKSKPATVGIEIGNYRGIGQVRFQASKVSDIPSVVTGVVDSVQQYGTTFFSEMSNYDHVYDLMSKDDAGSWDFCPLHDRRAKLCLCFCVLMQDQAKFNFHVNNKIEWMKGRQDVDITGFEKFAEYLQNNFKSVIDNLST